VVKASRGLEKGKKKDWKRGKRSGKRRGRRRRRSGRRRRRRGRRRRRRRGRRRGRRGGRFVRVPDHELNADIEIVVGLLPNVHKPPHCEEVKRVERDNVVEDVVVVLSCTEEQDKEIQTPHHLGEAQEAEIALDVEEGKISEAGHPNVTRHEKTDRVVYGNIVEIVILNEQELHPALPLFGLLTIQDGVGLGVILLPAEVTRREKPEGHEPELVVVLEQVSVHRSVGVDGVFLADVCVKHDERELKEVLGEDVNLLERGIDALHSLGSKGQRLKRSIEANSELEHEIDERIHREHQQARNLRK
jgi:hypothetical protein